MDTSPLSEEVNELARGVDQARAAVHVVRRGVNGADRRDKPLK